MKWIVLFVSLYNGCSLAWEKIYLHKKQYLWCKSSHLPVVSFIHNALLMYNRNARVKYHYIWKGESISVNFWQVVVVSVDADILMYTGYLFSLVVVLNHIPIPNVELLLTVRKAWYDYDEKCKFNIMYWMELRDYRNSFIYIYIKSLGKFFGDQLKLSDIVKIRFQITAVANNIAVLTRRTKGNQWAYITRTE